MATQTTSTLSHLERPSSNVMDRAEELMVGLENYTWAYAASKKDLQADNLFEINKYAYFLKK